MQAHLFFIDKLRILIMVSKEQLCWRHTNRIPSIHILRYAMQMQIVVEEGMKQEIFIRKLSAFGPVGFLCHQSER
jgi:hypothetical protein